MEPLKKIIGATRERYDNAGKRELLPKDRHPHTAKYHQDQWAFISDESLRENIAYQMQYLEFMTSLYNDYQIYLTIESLIFKSMLTAVACVVEAALFDVIASSRRAGGLPMNERTEFTALLGAAYHSFGLIDREMWHYMHELRKVRNYVHLRAADFQEHTAYTFEETNTAIAHLERFRSMLAGPSAPAKKGAA